MREGIKVGLIGDHDRSVTAHRAIPIALKMSAESLNVQVEWQWLHSTVVSVATLHNYDALWCVPASPYEDTERVLDAIHYARTNNIPFLGTCGGYQHAALEFALNALDIKQAENSEINPDAQMPVISGLSCKLYDESASVLLNKDSYIAKLYGTQHISEDYFCGYGVNRHYLHLYNDSELVFSGFDEDGDPRSLEIPTNTFFIGTAFQPERSALQDRVHPLITAFLTVAQQVSG